MVALAGGGIHGMVLSIGGGTEIIGGVTRLGAFPSSILTPHCLFIFFEGKIIVMIFDTGIAVYNCQVEYVLGSIFFNVGTV